MMKIYKKCPDICLFLGEKPIELMNCLKKKFKVIDYTKVNFQEDESFENIFNQSKAGQTIILITKELKSFVKVKNIEYILLVDDYLKNILLEIKNNYAIFDLIEKVRKGPELVVLRNYSVMESFFERIKKAFLAVEGDFFELLELNHKGTIIGLTNNNLHESLSVKELYFPALYTSMSLSKVIDTLEIKSIEYINESLEDNKWNVYKIKIYDSYEQYHLHYNRLLFLIDSLDLGLVLNEGWGEDAGTIFNIVQVYEVYLFSTISKKILKEILVGAEYFENGDRIVDYDLFLEKKKIKWSILKTDNFFKKEDVGINCRKKLNEKLNKKQIKILNDIEKSILT